MDEVEMGGGIAKKKKELAERDILQHGRLHQISLR